jgi:hypothetical protein
MYDTEHMTDDALDREIAEALAVNPSPQFEARVRQRVSSERPSPVWALASLKIAAVFVLGVSSVVLWRNSREQPPLHGRAFVAAVTNPIAASSTIQLTEPTPPLARRSTRPVGVSRAVSAEPEILVDVREARATRALIVGVVDGSVDLAPLLKASTSAFLEVIPIPESDFAPSHPSPLPGGIIETGVPQ